MLDNLLQYITVLNMENQIIIKTPIYLTDTEYFCNKSWTISYNLNTKSWTSFHSYIPNFYIGENNFFYSGLNGCCSDFDGDFLAMVGELNKLITTTTTTTLLSTTTTSTTTEAVDCDLVGEVLFTYCSLEGSAVITVPPTTTTTICQRPSGLPSFRWFTGYEISPNPSVDSTISQEIVCAAIATVSSVVPYVSLSSISLNASSLSIGETVYLDETLTDCVFVPDGWYYTEEGLFNGFAFQVEAGAIKSIDGCACGTTTSTTTQSPNIPECCGVLFNSGNNIYYDVQTLNVPGFISSYGIALSENKLWSITTKIVEWDISLSPFSAVYNRDINFSGGFSTASGITYKSPNILIGVDDTGIGTVVEIDITGVTTVITNKFDLQTSRIAIGNPLYTTGGKLIIINYISGGDYFITQYNYETGAIEVDINTGITPITSLYECNCNIYVVDEDGVNYVIERSTPYSLSTLPSLSINPDGATQLNSCIASSITENSNITTTTTTTYFPNTFCYTVQIDGGCTVTWIDYNGDSQSQYVYQDTVYICAKQYSLSFSCDIYGPINITGGTTPCVTNEDCTP